MNRVEQNPPFPPNPVLPKPNRKNSVRWADWVKTEKGAEWVQRNRIGKRKRDFDRKTKIFKRYFGPIPKCSVCSNSDLRVLTIHHKNGGGGRHRAALTGYGPHIGGSKFYIALIKAGFPPNPDFQALCSNCHLIAHYESPSSPRIKPLTPRQQM